MAEDISFLREDVKVGSLIYWKLTGKKFGFFGIVIELSIYDNYRDDKIRIIVNNTLYWWSCCHFESNNCKIITIK